MDQGKHVKFKSEENKADRGRGGKDEMEVRRDMANAWLYFPAVFCRGRIIVRKANSEL